MDKNIKKERALLQSVIFSMNECCEALTALCEVNKLYKKVIEMSPGEKQNFILPPGIVVPLLGMARDCFCVRVANLFDKRKDVHSLKKYFHGDAIKKLEKHPIVVASIVARHNNICHMGKKYTKWPDIDNITDARDLKDLLESIKIGIIINR